MRYSWYYLENMLVYRIDSRKMAVAQDDLKRVNGKLNQLMDHLIEFILYQRLGMIPFGRMIEMSF